MSNELKVAQGGTTASFNQTGGSVNAQWAEIGASGTGIGTYNISAGTFKIGLTPLPTYSTYTLSSTAASNGEIDLAIRAGGPLGVIATDNAANAAYSAGWAAGSNATFCGGKVPGLLP